MDATSPDDTIERLGVFTCACNNSLFSHYTDFTPSCIRSSDTKRKHCSHSRIRIRCRAAPKAEVLHLQATLQWRARSLTADATKPKFPRVTATSSLCSSAVLECIVLQLCVARVHCAAVIWTWRPRNLRTMQACTGWYGRSVAGAIKAGG